MACAPLPVGGYECEFVESSIPESLSCPVCLLPFRDPHLLDCCGAKYCEVCIGRVKAANKPCPLCKQQFNTMLDKNDQRKVLGLKVRCSRKKDGCEWEGELRHLDHHEREKCVWGLVKCRYHCGERVPRRQLAEHEQDVCSQRPLDVKLKSFMRKMEERHMREIAALRKDLKKEKESHRVDIERMKQEREQYVEEKLAEQESKMRDEYDSKVNKIEEMLRVEVIPVIKGLTHHPLGALEYVLTEYSKHNKARDEWFSFPFYTGPKGYKLCLAVATSYIYGPGTHVSLWVFLMRGEYDDCLMWPFSADITVQLVNQKEDCDHYEKTLSTHNHNRVIKERESLAPSIMLFISHHEVESKTARRQYLKNDSLVFRITRILVNSM